MPMLLVFFGGGLGSLCRYLLATWVQSASNSPFAWGTLCVNVLGSFALGGIMQASLSTGAISPDLRLLLATGFMGGFTTYSTFNYDVLRFLSEGRWDLALGNIGATLSLCLLAGAAGMAGIRALGGN